ncbi:unnamed protein product [Oikopleura dioica]|uniref:DEK-C domain-containing protein n=1 Tax=Oikopleura dioica TaxID=34765 RepID=E4Y5E7_OIKDI|nr:unnamed protein product [Oikopleura dioica]
MAAGAYEMPIFDQKIEILYSKRKSRQVERFQSEITPTKPRKTPKKAENGGNGIGLAVSKMEKVCERFDMESEMDLKTVFYVFYLRRRVAKADVRARLKAFNGWNFTAASKHYPKALESLLSMTKPCIVWVMNILGMPVNVNDQKEHLIQRLADWCLRPIDHSDFCIVPGTDDEELEYDPRKAPKLEFEEDSMLEVGTGANGAQVVCSTTIAGEFDLNCNSSSPRVPHISHVPTQPSFNSQPAESTSIRQFARSYTPVMPLTTAPNIIRQSNPADNPRLPMKKRIRQRHTPSAPVDLTEDYLPTDDEVRATIRVILSRMNVNRLSMQQVRRLIFRKYPDFDVESRKDWIKSEVSKFFRPRSTV